MGVLKRIKNNREVEEKAKEKDGLRRELGRGGEGRHGNTEVLKRIRKYMEVKKKEKEREED